MKSNSSERLKELMAYYGINQTDICKKTGIPKSAISMYLSGKRSPRQDRISDIAEAYGVDEAWIMGYDVPMSQATHNNIDSIKTIHSTEYDAKLLEDFHSLDKQGQETIQYIMRNELKRCENIYDMRQRISELEENKESNIPKRVLVYYGKIAAAGIGFGFDDIVQNGTIEVPVTNESKQADYAIGINGNSMDPTFSDGDIVLVKKAERIDKGEIGIFQKDNGIYIKEVGENELLSHNPNYKPIENNGEIICLGKVICKI